MCKSASDALKSEWVFTMPSDTQRHTPGSHHRDKRRHHRPRILKRHNLESRGFHLGRSPGSWSPPHRQRSNWRQCIQNRRLSRGRRCRIHWRTLRRTGCGCLCTARGRVRSCIQSRKSNLLHMCKCHCRTHPRSWNPRIRGGRAHCDS